MRRTPVALITIVGSLVLAACTGDSSTTSPPRGVVPQASSTTLLSFPTCTNNSFSTMTQDAKAYFPAKDPVFDSIANMKKLFGTSIPAATPTGFNILARTATVRDGALQIGSAAAGGKFVLDVVGCMDVLPIDDSFKPDQALDNGVFEVESTGSAAALAKLASAGHATVNASPLWGAEPNGTWNRAAAIYGGYLVYGYPLGTDVTASGFEMGTIPQGISRNITDPALLFRVGLCIPPANTNHTSANRLIHANAIVTGLFDPSSTQDQGAHFCVGNVATTSASWLTRLASSTFSVFTPKLLFAQSSAFDGIGGLPDGWSPSVPNSIPGTSVVLSFTTPPSNVADSVAETVVVRAMNGSTPVPGVIVTITIAGNSGVPASAVLIGTTTQTTDKNGYATFSLAYGKPGGYTVTASGTLSGVQTQSVTSALFQVSNK